MRTSPIQGLKTYEDYTYTGLEAKLRLHLYRP